MITQDLHYFHAVLLRLGTEGVFNDNFTFKNVSFW